MPFEQQDVAGLDVEMDDTAPVRIVERERDLTTQANRFLEIDLGVTKQSISQRFSSRSAISSLNLPSWSACITREKTSSFLLL